MGSDVDDVIQDIKFFKRKLDIIGKHGRSEDLLDIFLMKKRKINDLGDTDDDFLTYLNGLSTSSDPLHKLSDEDGDDPHYALALSRLKKDGSSYILEADERFGLTKPLKYEEDESNDVGAEDINSPYETQWTESIDPDYAFFYDNLRVSRLDLIFQHGSGLPTIYYQDESNCHQVDNGANQVPKLSLHKEKSSCSSEEDKYRKHCKQERKKWSKFRVQIMKILSKPYDKEEHQKLWQDITVQKSQLKHIDLRSGDVRFIESDKVGKSYLDHHGDLKRKVKAAAKDDCKHLNLLRGFFFWIQNLTQDGSFVPWKDEECLAVRPKAR